MSEELLPWLCLRLQKNKREVKEVKKIIKGRLKLTYGYTHLSLDKEGKQNLTEILQIAPGSYVTLNIEGETIKGYLYFLQNGRHLILRERPYVYDAKAVSLKPFKEFIGKGVELKIEVDPRCQ